MPQTRVNSDLPNLCSLLSSMLILKANSHVKPILIREYVALHPIPTDNPTSFKNCGPEDTPAATLTKLLQVRSHAQGYSALDTKVKEQERNSLSYIPSLLFYQF